MRSRALTYDFLKELAEATITSKELGAEQLFVQYLASLRNVDSSLVICKFTKDSFPEKLTKMAVLCRKKGAEEILTKLVKSIPSADNSFNYTSTKTDKPKTQGTKTRNETSKTKDGFTKHQGTCKKSNRNNVAIKRHKCSRSRKKGKIKKLRNTSNYKKQKCMLCKTKSGSIYNHYRAMHKIDFTVWLKRITESRRDSYNDTICLQCNVDFNNAPGLSKHMIEYHKISLKRNLRKILVKARKSKYLKEIFGKKKTVSKAVSETIERENNGHAQEKVVNSQVRQNEKQKAVDLSKIEHFCVQCDKYVKIHLFESHTAAHQEEREGYAFL